MAKYSWRDYMACVPDITKPLTKEDLDAAMELMQGLRDEQAQRRSRRIQAEIHHILPPITPHELPSTSEMLMEKMRANIPVAFYRSPRTGETFPIHENRPLPPGCDPLADTLWLLEQIDKGEFDTEPPDSDP